MNLNDRYLARITRLPSAPSLAAELLPLFKDPDRDVDHIVRLVCRDPALTAAILRRCNSAFFTGDYTAANVFEALTRLGFFVVYCLAATLLVSGAACLPAAKDGLDVDDLSQHLITTALAASA